MGMFDTVFMICPYCSQFTSEQTKVGNCILKEFQLNEDMLTTIGMLGDHKCEHCKKIFTIELIDKPFAQPRKK